MESKKDLIIKLCEGLQRDLNILNTDKTPQKFIKVEFIAKSAAGGIPHMPEGEQKEAAAREAYVTQIVVDDQVVFREIYYARKNTDDSIIEEMICDRLLRSVFCWGVMASKKAGQLAHHPNNIL